jgi:cell division protein FtsN
MQTDYDDYDDENPSMRWMSIVVLLLAVAGFFSLAWYAYYTGTKSVQTGDIVIIEADNTPLKEQPEDRGGMEFPHQEKTIYNAVSNKNANVSKDTKVIDESEEVVIPDDMPESDEAADEKIAAILKNAANETQQAKQPATQPESARKAIEPAAKSVEAKPEAELVKPAPVAELKPKEAPDPTPPVAAPKPAASPKPAAPAPLAVGGSYKIQLGAFRSLAEAENTWTTASAKHANVLAGRPHEVVRADLGAKGIYYRLRVGGFASSAATKTACATLSAQKQGCFPVGQ